MNQLTRKFDEILDSIQSMLMSILVKLGPFFVALMPAMFTAYATLHTFANEADYRLAVFFALVVGVAIETVGIVATHSAVDLYNAWQAEIAQPVKFYLMVGLVPVYVVTVAAIVYFAPDAFTDLVRGLGIGSPFLTCIVYIAVALAGDIRRIEARQENVEAKQDALDADKLAWEREKEIERVAWEREQKRIEMEQKHTEKLARIEAKNGAKNAQSAAKSEAQNSENSAKNGQISPPLRVPKSEWRAQAIEILRENPHISGAQLGRNLGASDRTGQNILNELEQAGVIHRNGQGIEVRQ